MPLPIEVFDTSLMEFERLHIKKVIEFFKSHKDNAYNVREIMIETNVAYQSVLNATKILTRKGTLIKKFLGRMAYFAYNSQQKQSNKKEE